MENIKTNSSLLGGFGLTLLGTTCCALPVALVSLGMGGVVASMVSAVPMLAWLSKYKALTFSLTALVLAYGGWRLRGVSQSSQCSLEDGKRLKWQSGNGSACPQIWHCERMTCFQRVGNCQTLLGRKSHLTSYWK